MASLRFHRVLSLPESCTRGDVYYVEDKGIYVCINSADSGATESNYQRFSFANSATKDAKGVVSLNDVKGVKVNSAVAAQAQVKCRYLSQGFQSTCNASDKLRRIG